MSRATVRAAVAAWFAPPAVAGLNWVYRAPPKLWTATNYKAGALPGAMSGAQAAVFIESEVEPRIAFGGPVSGKKAVAYELGLILHFMSTQLLAEDAQDDYDALIENIKDRIRQDRQFGTALNPSPLLEVGNRHDGITVISDLPKQNNDRSIFIWSVVKLQAQEIVTA